MFLSKNAKRFMSTAAVLAMTVASLVVAPKVEAAEVAPTVTVKGATLKLEGNEDGKQSMRIAVEVSNADVASACGMDITYGGKTTTIATDKEQNKIYDVDTENKKVVYTAVIKNIPDTAFASDFTINGLVKKTAATEYTKTAATKKSVNGIVEALGTDYKMIEGKLVKKLTALADFSPATGLYAWETVAYDSERYTVGSDKEDIFSTGEIKDSYKDEKCLAVSKVTGTTLTDKSQSGLCVKFSDENVKSREFYVDATACATNGIEVVGGTTTQKGENKDVFENIKCWVSGVNQWGRIRLKACNEDDILYVKSFDVYEKVKELSTLKLAKNINVDLQAVAKVSGVTYDADSEGIKILAKPADNGTKVKIFINSDKSLIKNYSEYEKAVIEFTSDTAGVSTYSGLMADDDYWGHFRRSENYTDAVVGNNVVELPIEGKDVTLKDGTNVQYVSFGYNTYGKDAATCPDVTYVIKSIKLVAKK